MGVQTLEDYVKFFINFLRDSLFFPPWQKWTSDTWIGQDLAYVLWLLKELFFMGPSFKFTALRFQWKSFELDLDIFNQKRRNKGLVEQLEVEEKRRVVHVNDTCQTGDKKRKLKDAE